MGINKRYIKKFDQAYKGIPETIIPIEFVPTSPYYHIEEWREILQMFIPGVLPHTYWISNMGRVYSNLKSKHYPNGGILNHSINEHGYHQVNLQSIDKKKIGVKIARLIMLHFRFVPGCHLFEVDHLDGNKDNNVLWNFEWVSPQENTHRAIKNGLRALSCYIDNGTLLSDYDARSLFNEALVSNDYLELSKKYNVTVDYINGLIDGSIRPYIRREYISNN